MISYVRLAKLGLLFSVGGPLVACGGGLSTETHGEDFEQAVAEFVDGRNYSSTDPVTRLCQEVISSPLESRAYLDLIEQVGDVTEFPDYQAYDGTMYEVKQRELVFAADITCHSIFLGDDNDKVSYGTIGSPITIFRPIDQNGNEQPWQAVIGIEPDDPRFRPSFYWVDRSF